MEIVIFILGLLFIRIIQPLLIISILIIIVLIYSYLIYNVIEGYWFRYALVIVILRGVLVIFTYIISLIPNERFERYNLVFVIFLIFIFFGYFIYKYFFNKNYISLILWNFRLRIFNIFVVRFLLRIILIVVWIRSLNKGAVRIRFLCAWIKG